MVKENPKKSGIYLFVYFFTWLSGIIVFFIAKDDNRLKFHSLQAIFLGVVAVILDLVLFFVPFLGSFLAFLIWVYGMYIAVKAYGGKDIKVPVIGDYASQYSHYSK